MCERWCSLVVAPCGRVQEGVVTGLEGGEKDDLTKETSREEPLMWVGSEWMLLKGDWDLLVVMVITGGMGLLEVMEWSGRRLLGVVLSFAPQLFCSPPLLRCASSDQNS
jgi:hypothetical protein